MRCRSKLATYSRRAGGPWRRVEGPPTKPRSVERARVVGLESFDESEPGGRVRRNRLTPGRDKISKKTNKISKSRIPSEEANDHHLEAASRRSASLSIHRWSSMDSIRSDESRSHQNMVMLTRVRAETRMKEFMEGSTRSQTRFIVSVYASAQLITLHTIKTYRSRSYLPM